MRRFSILKMSILSKIIYEFSTTLKKKKKKALGGVIGQRWPKGTNFQL